MIILSLTQLIMSYYSVCLMNNTEWIDGCVSTNITLLSTLSVRSSNNYFLRDLNAFQGSRLKLRVNFVGLGIWIRFLQTKIVNVLPTLLLKALVRLDILTYNIAIKR